MGHSWADEDTLGGKAKTFQWKIDEDCTVSIKRVFHLESGTKENIKTVSSDELEKINAFVSSENWCHLANNVDKLRHGTEKEGIGKFLYDELGWNETDCQLASHLGPIFFMSGVWDYNGRKRGIMFKRMSMDWCRLIKRYYKRSVSRA